LIPTGPDPASLEVEASVTVRPTAVVSSEVVATVLSEPSTRTWHVVAAAAAVGEGASTG